MNFWQKKKSLLIYSLIGSDWLLVVDTRDSTRVVIYECCTLEMNGKKNGICKALGRAFPF